MVCYAVVKLYIIPLPVNYKVDNGQLLVFHAT